METRVIVLKSCFLNSIVINKLVFTDATRVVTLSPTCASIGQKITFKTTCIQNQSSENTNTLKKTQREANDPVSLTMFSMIMMMNLMMMMTTMMVMMMFDKKDNYTRDGQRSCHLVSLFNWAPLQIK